MFECLRQRPARFISTVAMLMLMALAYSAARAEYVLDTGTPTGINDAYVVYNDSAGSFQELGITFELSSFRELTSVEGWMNTHAGGLVTAALWAGSPSVAGAPLFTSTSFVDTSNAKWVNFGDLSWAVGAGTYALTFSGAVGYDGGMPDHAAVNLPTYWSRNELVSDWTESHGLTIGARIDAAASPVPEPEIGAMMLAGLGFVAFAVRRRTRG